MSPSNAMTLGLLWAILTNAVPKTTHFITKIVK